MDSSELIVGPYLHVKNQKKMSQFQKKKCYIRKDRHTEKLMHEKIELNTEDLPAETVVQYMRASSLKNLSIFYTKKRELLWWSYSVSSSSMPRRGTALLNHVVSYPAIFSGYRFFDKCNKEKNRSAAGESRRGTASPPKWDPQTNLWKILAILHSNSSKHRFHGSAHCGTSAWTVICLFLDELIFTLLRVWGSEFGISNRITGFKIALDMALPWFMYSHLFLFPLSPLSNTSYQALIHTSLFF